MPPLATSDTQSTMPEDIELQGPRPSNNSDRRATHLNPTQLVRKRAYDREAQRRSRKRTNDHIKALEITLGAQEEYSSQLLHTNGALEAKIVELQSQLSGQTQIPRATSIKPEVLSDDEATPVGAYPYGRSDFIWDYPSQVSSEGLDIAPTTMPRSLISSNPSSIPPLYHHSNTNEELYNYEHTNEPTQATSNVETLGSNLMHTQTSSLAISHSTRAMDHVTPDSVSTCWQAQPSVYAWQISTKILPPNTPTDQMVIAAIQSQRHLSRTNNISGQDLIGPTAPSLNMLFGWKAPPNMHPLPLAIITALGNLGPVISSPPERVASFLATYRLYQWQIDPNASTYANLLEWQAPRPSQLLTPHPLWMDNPPWGKFRDKIIENQEVYGTLEFQLDFFSHTSICWPYQPLDAVCLEDGHLRISPLMEKHLGRVENMKVDRAFMRKYPEFEGLCRSHDE